MADTPAKRVDPSCFEPDTWYVLDLRELDNSGQVVRRQTDPVRFETLDDIDWTGEGDYEWSLVFVTEDGKPAQFPLCNVIGAVEVNPSSPPAAGTR